MNFKKIILSLGISLSLLPLFAQSRPVVSDINAIPKEESIKLTWTLPENPSQTVTGCLIFRDTKQISSYEQLSSLTPVSHLASDVKNYTDKISDTRYYFYAVICTTDNGPYTIILPSINTTITGVRAATVSKPDEVITPSDADTAKKSSNYASDPSEKLRDVPLPTPGLIETTKPNKNLLGDKAIKAGSNLGKDYTGKRNKITKMHIFEEDMVCPEGGDDYFLFKILKNNFIKKNFKSAAGEFTDFLSVHRSEQTTARATFYLGEAYYFSKDYEKAVFNFLAVKDSYPELAKKWIDSCLDLIEIKN